MVLQKILESHLDCNKSILSILKEITPGYSLEGLILKLKLQYLGHLMWKADSFEKTLMLGKIEGRRRREWQKMGWLDGITNSIDKGLGGLRKLVMDRDSWHAARGSWGWKELDVTEWLNWTEVLDFMSIYRLSIPLSFLMTLDYAELHLIKRGKGFLFPFLPSTISWKLELLVYCSLFVPTTFMRFYGPGYVEYILLIWGLTERSRT